MSNSRLQYPPLDQRALMHFFDLSAIPEKYVFNSNEPNLIAPLNWRLNVSRNSMHEKSLSHKVEVNLPLSMIALDDTSDPISDAEVFATLEDQAIYELQRSMGILDPDEDYIDGYYDYETGEIYYD